MAQNGIIRIKQADGSYITVQPTTKTDNVTNEAGKTVTQILAEDVAEKNHDHKYVSDVPSTVDLGGISKGFTTEGETVEEMLFKLLHPYVKPTISYACSPNGGTYEIGAKVASITVTATGNRQSDIIQRVRIYKGSNVVETVDHGVAGNCTASYTETDLMADATFKADVYDGKNTVTSSTTTFKFVRPAFVGKIAGDKAIADLVSDDITGMTKKVQSPGNLENTYTLDTERMCVALPPGWTLKEILDPHGVNITSSFDTRTVAVDCLDGQSINYTVYLSGPTSQTGFKVKFNK